MARRETLFGYRVEKRKLLVDEDAAAHVRWIFARFLEIGSCTILAHEVHVRGLRTSHGNRIDKKYLYRMLSNRAYTGEAVHKGDSYPGEHDAIIAQDPWDMVHLILKESPRARRHRTRAQTPALLKGLLYGPDGAAFSPTHARKLGRLFRYYVSQSVLKFGKGACPIGRVPAGDLETEVINQLPRCSGSLRSLRGLGRRRGRMTPASPKRTRLKLCGGSIPCGTNCSSPSRRAWWRWWSRGWTLVSSGWTCDCGWTV
jgi:hypothetical protein